MTTPFAPGYWGQIEPDPVTAQEQFFSGRDESEVEATRRAIQGQFMRGLDPNLTPFASQFYGNRFANTYGAFEALAPRAAGVSSLTPTFAEFMTRGGPGAFRGDVLRNLRTAGRIQGRDPRLAELGRVELRPGEPGFLKYHEDLPRFIQAGEREGLPTQTRQVTPQETGFTESIRQDPALALRTARAALTSGVNPLFAGGISSLLGRLWERFGVEGQPGGATPFLARLQQQGLI